MYHHLTLPGSSAAAVSYPVKIKENVTTFPYFFTLVTKEDGFQIAMTPLKEN